MKHIYRTTFKRYMMLALFIVLPGLSVDTGAADAPRPDRNVEGKPLPPIDREMPAVLETAYFGLG